MFALSPKRYDGGGAQKVVYLALRNLNAAPHKSTTLIHIV